MGERQEEREKAKRRRSSLARAGSAILETTPIRGNEVGTKIRLLRQVME